MLPSLSSVKKRTRIMVIIILVCFCALILRLAYWQVVRGNEMSKIAQSQQQVTASVRTERGKIYDRNGKVMAESASAKGLACNPQDVEENGDPETVADKVSLVLGLDRDKVLKQLTSDTSYQSIKKQLTTEEEEMLRGLMENEENPETAEAFSGVYFEDGTRRYYPYNAAAAVIGIVDSDGNGKSGIESSFDDALLGKPGFITSARSASGTTLKDQQAEYQTAAENGCDVVLTIDETIQHFLESQLETAVEDYQLKEGAAGIVMNPQTGEILAMASKPDFDSNDPYNIDEFYEYLKEYDSDLISSGDDEEDEDEEAEETPSPTPSEDADTESVRKTSAQPSPTATPKPSESVSSLTDEQIATLRAKMWRNKAISDSYEPGSTFKIITAAAALEEHIVDDNSTFYCAGFKVVADRKISCANTDGHGPETFEEGVKNSCNPVFMELGMKLGSDKFKEYFNAFGLGEPTGVELGGESTSISYSGDMSEVDLATSSFGQGIQITPIQLVTAVSAVVNGGTLMHPHIVKEIRDSDGVVKSYEPETVNRVISEETSARMREILESVVSDPTATGKNAYVKGCRIGGKTGTSEKNPRGSDKRIASFVGFAPANDPQVVCLIMLDEPQTANRYGGTLAAPLTGELIEKILNYLGVEKQYSEDEVADVEIEVPDVREDDIDTAEELLEDEGFTVKIKGEGDTVVDQLPLPGNMLSEDSTIVLYTEETDEDDKTVKVPDVTGGTVSDARDILESYDLNFEVVGAGHSDAYGSYAAKQSVKAGEEVPAGTVVGVEFRQTASD